MNLVCFALTFRLIGYIFRYLNRGLTASYLFLNSITIIDFLRDLFILFNFAIDVTFQVIILYSQKRLIKLLQITHLLIRNNDQRGGGVAIYVHNSLGFKISKKQSINSNHMEWACIELVRKNVKNINVSCIYQSTEVTHINFEIK